MAGEGALWAFMSFNRRAPARQASRLAIDPGGRLVATGPHGFFSSPTLDVYLPPFSNATTKAFTIGNAGGGSPSNVAFDALGDLYVMLVGAPGKIAYFQRPLSASSTPLATLSLPTGQSPTSIAIKP